MAKRQMQEDMADCFVWRLHGESFNMGGHETLVAAITRIGVQCGIKRQIAGDCMGKYQRCMVWRMIGEGLARNMANCWSRRLHGKILIKTWHCRLMVAATASSNIQCHRTLQNVVGGNCMVRRQTRATRKNARGSECAVRRLMFHLTADVARGDYTAWRAMLKDMAHFWQWRSHGETRTAEDMRMP